MPHANTLQQSFWWLNVFPEKGDILVEKTCTQGSQTFHQPRSYYRGIFLYINLNYINFHTTGRGPWRGSSFGKQFLVLGHINLIFSSLDCKFPKISASKWNTCNELFWIDMPVCVSGRHFYTPAPRRGRGVYCFTSVRPSNIFFVAFFSVTVDGRNLIFGHKHHLGIPYCG